jgi:putative membrane protein
MSSFFAFLHHVAAFALVAALAVEFVLLKENLTVGSATKVRLADLAFGVSAGVVMVVGLLRVFYFEKGATYYFRSAPFLAKLSLFAVIGLLSIYPTREFLSWKGALRQGLVPSVAPDRVRRVRAIIHWELAGIVVLLLCAALMARGVGLVGA